MEVDTGAAVSQQLSSQSSPGGPTPSNLSIVEDIYGESLDIVGELPVEVEYQQVVVKERDHHYFEGIGYMTSVETP